MSFAVLERPLALKRKIPLKNSPDSTITDEVTQTRKGVVKFIDDAKTIGNKSFVRRVYAEKENNESGRTKVPFHLFSDSHFSLNNKTVQELIHHFKMLQMGKTKAPYICIPGDIFDVVQGSPNPAPFIKEFLNGISPFYKKVLFVPGNHCLRNRANPWNDFKKGFAKNVVIPTQKQPRTIRIDGISFCLANLYPDGSLVTKEFIDNYEALGLSTKPSRESLTRWVETTGDMPDNRFPHKIVNIAAAQQISNKLRGILENTPPHILITHFITRSHVLDFLSTSLDPLQVGGRTAFGNLKKIMEMSIKYKTSPQKILEYFNTRNNWMGSDFREVLDENSIASVFGHNHSNCFTPSTITHQRKIVSIRQPWKNFQKKEQIESPKERFYFRVLRVKQYEQFENLTEDQGRNIVMLMTEDTVNKLLNAKTMEDVLRIIGYPEEFIGECRENQTQFKICAFKKENTLPRYCGDWEGLQQFITDDNTKFSYKNKSTDEIGELINKLKCVYEENTKGKTGSDLIEALQNIKSKMIQEEQDFREYLEKTLNLNSLFTGNGYTINNEGETQGKEFFTKNTPLKDIPHSLLMDCPKWSNKTEYQCI